jgi:hypothetical protein
VNAFSSVAASTIGADSDRGASSSRLRQRRKRRTTKEVYAGAVVGEPLPLAGDAGQERMAVIRTFGDTKALIALLNAGHPVLAVLRTSEEERRRVVDLLTG